MLIVLLFHPQESKSQYVTIPDPEFVAFLQNDFPQCMNGNQMDTTCSAIINLSDLNVSNTNIISLEGVQYFKSLYHLQYSYGMLETLGSALPPNLNGLSIEVTQITTLPQLPASLKHMYVAYNQLTTLPVLPDSLQFLNCDNNYLSYLLPLPSQLMELKCSYNQLLELPELPDGLITLIANNNFSLTCSPKLNKELFEVDFRFTGIECLPNIPHSLAIVNDIPNVSSVPICPPGNPCHINAPISGFAKIDANNNCIADSDDPPMQSIEVGLMANNGLFISNYHIADNGYFNFFPEDTGLYKVIFHNDINGFYYNCPGDSFLVFSVADLNANYSEEIVFNCLNNSDHNLAMNYMHMDSGMTFPGQKALIRIGAGNSMYSNVISCTNTVNSGTLTITINGPAQFDGVAAGSLYPDVVNGNVLTWNIPDWSLMNNWQSFRIRLLTNTNAQSGNIIELVAEINGSFVDLYPNDNMMTIPLMVLNSYDPNEKTVYPIGDLLYPYTDYLSYTIHFQNTGNAPAFNILIADTLEENLDTSTFLLVANSHPVSISQNGNILHFEFNNILLPDSASNEPNSHGFVQFKIKPISNLITNTNIHNRAAIYFDFNDPIITNQTSTYIYTPNTTPAFEFAPIGATWYYDQVCFGSCLFYYKFTSVDTATIGGLLFKKLEVYSLDFLLNDFPYNYIYVYADSSKMYYALSPTDEIKLLVDYDLNVGDTLISNALPGYPNSKSLVVGKSDTTINGFALKYLKLENTFDQGMVFYGKCLQYIGNESFMFPLAGFADPPVGGDLRCYFDSQVIEYRNPKYSNPFCDYYFIPSVESIEENNIQIYPNPAHDFIQINSGSPIQVVALIELTGRRIYELGNLYQTSLQIPATDLSDGLYLIQAIMSTGEIVHSRILIQH